MAKQVINIGAIANDGTGDPVRTAFDKSNDNFTELYGKPDLSLSANTLTLTRADGSTDTVDLSIYLDEDSRSISSGTVNESGIVTFIRDDASTFTLDLSALLLVTSVNNQVGAVVLDADDINDASTTNKFTTAEDISKLSGIEENADITDTTNVTASGALMDSEVTDLAGIKAITISTLQPKPSEGAFANGDKTKLDGVEENADVTDTNNVTAAGALMDSEVVNLSQVKAFDSSDYATAAQGTLADSAQQPLAEGAFVDGDKTKLDSIEANADATDAASVTAAGALMDSEVTDLTGIKGVTVSTLQVKPSEGAFTDGDKTKLNSIESGAEVNRTDGAIRDIVGGMLGGTETGISVTYQNGTGDIDFVVESQTDENFTTADHSKLNGIEVGAEVNTVDSVNTQTGAVVLDSDDISEGTTNRYDQTVSLAAGTNITVTGTYPSFTIESANTNTQLSTEEVQDIVGAMFTGNTQTGITVTYQDDDGTIDLSTSIGDITEVLVGGGLVGGGTTGSVTITHEDTSGQASVNNSGRTYIQGVTLDDYGHVTGLTSATESVSNTDTNYFLDGITKSGNVLTFSVSGATNQTYTFGSNAFTSTAIPTNNSDLPNGAGYATTAEVNTAISNVIDTAPANLDTLNELAAALGDDANFASTVTTALAGKQAVGTYNTIIGTDTDINTSGSTIVDNINVTDGVITSMGTRVLTLADLGYTGATNANNYSHPTFNGDDFSIDTGALTGATVISDLDINITTNSQGHVTDTNGTVATRNLTLANLGYTGATNANYITNNNQLTNGAGYTTNTGTITSVSTSAGLDGAATSGGVTISLDLSELTDMTAAVSTTVDELILLDNGAERRKRFSEIFGSNAYNSTTIPTNNNQLTNGASYLTTSGKAADSNLLDGLDLHTGRNNVANRVVRTNGSGYAEFGWINTTSGNTTNTITDIYVNTNDGYIRKATGAHFRSQVTDAYYTNNAGDITNVTAGGGLTGGGTSGSVTVSHSNTSSQASVNNSGRTYIQDISLDTYGHITSITSATETVVNTDTNTTYSADGNYGMTLSGTAFRLENDRRRNSTSTDVHTGNTHDYTFYDASHGIRWYTAGAEEMRLENDGDLHVDGDVIAFSTTVSDERLKDNIITIDSALDKVEALRGVSYTWNEGNRKGKSEIGVIAQEVEKVFPDIVHDKKLPFVNDKEYKTVDYEKLTAVLIEAVKELSQEVKELKKQING
jgi:hypothetical protein